MRLVKNPSGQMVKTSTGVASKVSSLKDLLPNASVIWIASDVQTYTPSSQEQSDNGVSSTTRVSLLADLTGGYHLRRDQGAWSSAYARSSPIPGPLWIPSSQCFNGHPAVRFDSISGGMYSMLSPQIAPQDSNYYFNSPNGWAAPWSVAMLVRPTVLTGAGCSVFDSVLGSTSAGPTINPANQVAASGNWSVANWNNGSAGGLIITSGHAPSLTETVLIIVTCNPSDGTNSSFTIYWRGSDGILAAPSAVSGTLSPNALRECFFGLVHESYLAMCVIKNGAFDFGELATFITWAAPYMPQARTISLEP